MHNGTRSESKHDRLAPEVLGDAVRSGRPAGHDGLAAGTCLEQAGLSGVRAPPPAQTAQRTAPDHGGAQLGAAEGVVAGDYGGGGVPGTGSPAKSTWAIYRQNLDGSEPRYYLSNAQKAPRWRPWPTWEGRGGALKPNSRPKRATSGWTSTRPGVGLAGITTWPCACWAGRFCWVCSRTGGKDASRRRHGVSRGSVSPARLRREQEGPVCSGTP